MSVVNVWVGGATSSTVTVVGKVTGSSVRLVVADNPGLSSPAFFGPVTPTAAGIVRIDATGLGLNARYHYALEDDGVVDATFRGQFRTHPTLGQPASFTVGMATCAGSSSSYPGVPGSLVAARLSNHPVFDTIRLKALAEDWALFIHGGDLHYYDIGSGVHVPGHDLATYRRAYDDVLLQPRQHALYRNVATAYMYDDHDFGPDNADSTSPGRLNAMQVYQERVPHHQRGASGPQAPNYQSFQIGRVLFVMWDVRADRHPGTGTMLGAAQKAWFESILTSSTARVLVLVNPSQWDADTFTDAWAGFPQERAEIVGMLAAPGGDTSKNWLPRMCIAQGDHHALGISSSNLWGGFPIFQFASLDSGPGADQAWRDVGSLPGRAMFGTLEVEDTGSSVTVTGIGWADGEEAMRYVFTVPDQVDLPATVQNTQPSKFAASNTTFGTGFVSGSYRDCGVVFIAPPSGRVVLHWSGGARISTASATSVAYLSPEVRTGGVVGSGTVVSAPDGRRSRRSNIADVGSVRAGSSYLLAGLTPEVTYNARMLHCVTSLAGEFFQRGLIVEPGS